MKVKLAKRVITIGWSTANTLSGAVFSVLLSIEVVRLCSKDLWGSMVQVMLWFGLASHILDFGNEDLLLREFSMMPKAISANWSKSLQARSLLFIIASIVLIFLPIEMKLKFLLFIFLAANFIYRSYDVIILFKRKFMFTVLLETGGFLLIASYILINKPNMSLNRLVTAYTGAEIGKSLILLFLFRKEFTIPSLKIHPGFYSLAFPFFLLGFSGLLQSKTDLICVTWFLTKDKVAQYQVYINFLLLVQSAAGFLLAPFVKNLYRMRNESVQKLALNFFGFGIVLASISIFFINIFIQRIYHFTIPITTLIVGALFIMPAFYYVPVIYQLIKIKKQNSVVLFNIVGVGAAFILNIILIPMSSDGISGAIWAIAITQWILFLIYLAIRIPNTKNAIAS